MFETTYGVVEGALVQTYGVPSRSVGAFRGRLGNLQKQGLFGAANMPGRGAPLGYGPDQIHRLVLACELFEFGVSPSTVLALVEERWTGRLRRIFQKAEDAAQRDPGPDDIVLSMGGVSLMRNGWSNEIPNVNSCTKAGLQDHMNMWMG